MTKQFEQLNEIIQGECLEVIKNIPDDSIDLTVTSPPYDNLRAYNRFEIARKRVSDALAEKETN